jgi:uncharacterized membrane protein
MLQWVRRNFIAGFFVTVPLVISVAALVWIFRLIDGLVGPIYDAWLPWHIPGLGILTTALVVLVVGMTATNVIGKRILQRAESYLTRVPVFRTIYAPVKQLVVAFSPDNEYGFKRVALVEDASRGCMLGFLTKEFTVDRGSGPEELLAVYVPTNHLYLGDVIICSPGQVQFPEITVEQGIRIFLTGGMAIPGRMRVRPGDDDGRLSRR